MRLIPTKYAWMNVTEEIPDGPSRDEWKHVVGDRALGELAGGSRDALKTPLGPPGWGPSIFGSPRSWLPTDRSSEYQLLWSWRVIRGARYVADVVVPSVPLTPPAWVPELITWPLWHPSRIDQCTDHNSNWTTHRHEAWFFINGIMTNAAVAELNSRYLAHLFHRPITVIQNATAGLLEDLVECAYDKAFGSVGEAATRAVPPIYDALKDPDKDRVVVIAHSQGTIIAGVVLRFLGLLYPQDPRPAATGRLHGGGTDGGSDASSLVSEASRLPDDMPLDPGDFAVLTDDEMSKLELYCFANCASQMPFLKGPPERPIPWIESYGNEHDIVARLGVLAPRPEKWGIRIDGPRYERKGAWGHLLNAHYLAPIERAQRRGRRRGPGGDGGAPFVLANADAHPDATVPRLFSYLNGGSPAATHGPAVVA